MVSSMSHRILPEAPLLRLVLPSLEIEVTHAMRTLDAVRKAVGVVSPITLDATPPVQNTENPGLTNLTCFPCYLHDIDRSILH